MNIKKYSLKRMERFWEKVNVTHGGCWEWKASLINTGYGRFWNGERVQLAHRFLYEMVNGLVPEGFELDHLCRNRKCVNPRHLEIVTRRENLLRGIGPSRARAYQLAKTHCPKGHPYDKENTYILPNGGRDCRECRKAAGKRWREEQVAN